MKIKRGDGLNIVPFIDVMLVLLALVLSVSTFIAQGNIKVDVPNANSQSQPDSQEKYTIVVSEDSKIYINDKEIKEDELVDALSGVPNDRMISYKGDKQSNLSILVKVIDLLSQQGHQSDKFQIDTQKN